MFVKVFLSVLFSSFAFASAGKYDGYKIYDINAKNVTEKDVLVRLSENSDYDFFILPRALGESAQVMVPPKEQVNFEATLKNFGIDFIIVDENFGQTAEMNPVLRSGWYFPASSGISFYKYNRYSEINDYLDILAILYPERVQVFSIGESYQKRDMKAIAISNGDRKTNKKVILIDAGIHAREWIAPASALYVIYQLVENYFENRHLLETYDWIVVPLVNPDGYEYSRMKDPMWRKTRKPSGFQCFGTDGNRNFDFYWGKTGTSSNPCADTFKGSKPFSEPETQNLRNLMHVLSGRAKFYLTLHSYGNYLLYPWGYTYSLPSTWKDIDEVAQAGAAAIKAATGTKYTVGSMSRTLYTAAGNSDDYALAEAKIPICITMELTPRSTGFHPKPVFIDYFVSEAWYGITAMARKVMSKY